MAFWICKKACRVLKKAVLDKEHWSIALLRIFQERRREECWAASLLLRISACSGFLCCGGSWCHSNAVYAVFSACCIAAMVVVEVQSQRGVRTQRAVFLRKVVFGEFRRSWSFRCFIWVLQLLWRGQSWDLGMLETWCGKFSGFSNERAADQFISRSWRKWDTKTLERILASYRMYLKYRIPKSFSFCETLSVMYDYFWMDRT